MKNKQSLFVNPSSGRRVNKEAAHWLDHNSVDKLLGDYKVTLADRSPEVLGRLDRDERIRIAAADVEDS